MKISKGEVFRLPTAESKQNSTIGCRVYSDSGLYGDGEAGMAYGVGGDAAFSMVAELAGLIMGMDPFKIELIWETMYKSTFWGQNGGPVIFSGIAAIDIALWDIKGKHFGGPIAKAATLQVEAVIPNFVIHEEHNANLLSSFKRAGKYYHAPEKGCYKIPELPGIG